MSASRCCAGGFVRILTLLVLSFLTAGIYSCSDSESPVEISDFAASDEISGESINSTTTMKWTFLLYIAADAGPDMFSPLESFSEQFCTSDNVEALVLEDTWGETAKIWYIDENHNTVMLEDLGEINMGSVTTLSSFLEYAKSNYTADRYIISFYGHGGAWGGACNDYDPSFDVLRMDDMREALTGAGGVDLVLFSAPCIMGTFEGAYELRECTDVYVASEGLSFYSIWRSTMGSISMELDANPNIQSHELGESIIGWIDENQDDYAQMEGMKVLTMSAIRTDRLGSLKNALDELALAYMPEPERFRALVESIRDRIISFSSVWIADLNTLLLNLHEVETDACKRVKIQLAMERLSDAVIAEIHHSSYKNIKGLSIFLPDEATANLLHSYVDLDKFGLDFVPDAHWDELLFGAFPEAETTQADAEESSRALRRLLAAPE